jgi:hypothetical protein
MMMDEQLETTYIYLDGEEERQQLIEAIRQVRREVLAIVEATPEDQCYEVRYHGWSLAAMLGHLNLMDNLYMLLISLALLGVRFPVPPEIQDGFNNFIAGIFRRRLIGASMRGAQVNEAKIADFINRLPVEKFTQQVYSVESKQYTTVERAVQEYFLFHWRNHLRTLRASEVLQQEPPESTDSLEE